MKKRNLVSVRKFWYELRRRYVVQVAVFYGAFAWVVIQMGDVQSLLPDKPGASDHSNSG